MSGKGHGARGSLLDRIAAKMSIPAKALWNQKAAHDYEQNQTDDENRGEPQ